MTDHSQPPELNEPDQATEEWNAIQSTKRVKNVTMVILLTINVILLVWLSLAIHYNWNFS